MLPHVFGFVLFSGKAAQHRAAFFIPLSTSIGYKKEFNNRQKMQFLQGVLMFREEVAKAEELSERIAKLRGSL
jgi:hypothetical protein